MNLKRYKKDLPKIINNLFKIILTKTELETFKKQGWIKK